jgi:hypothetical protein
VSRKLRTNDVFWSLFMLMDAWSLTHARKRAELKQIAAAKRAARDDKKVRLTSH